MMEAEIRRGRKKKEVTEKKCDGDSLAKEIIIKVNSKEIGRFTKPEKTFA